MLKELLLFATDGGIQAGVIIAIVVGVLLLIVLIFLPLGTWFTALVSKAHIPMSQLIGMKLRKLKYKMIVDAYIRAKKAGLDIEVVELESHVMAGGNVLNVVGALISAHSANIQLSL
ncbi:MAG: flotillin-like FloA family protein, partial [Clostridia bacterium]